MCTAVALPLIAGCGSGNRAVVTGTVTLDGMPLENGAINFYPTAGNKGPTAGSGIVNGHYRIEGAKGVAPGTNRVTISSSQKTGRKLVSRDGDAMDELAEAVPPKFNRKSTLTCEVLAGENELNFDLHRRIPIEKSRRKYSTR